ncbi:hypothetical protein BDV96DRAFT_607340 [Lophiotrema nucula]|uniref:Uncharacterized protein n=1 Tax=Lophiotrema nucula TaxID=690887 RepID=A0A6A5YJE9_9PLEO|nr:hypothetical protein BDV96DRAFT_607340 [Lophiotrema nucula]
MSDPQHPPGPPAVNYVQYQQDTTPAEPDLIPFPFDEVLEIKTTQGTFVLSQPHEAMVMLQRDVPNQLLFRDNDPPSHQPASPVDDDWFKDWSDRAEQATKVFEAGKVGVELGTAAAPVFTSIFNAMKKKNGAAPKAAPTKTAKYQPSSYVQAPVPASIKYYPSNPTTNSRPVSAHRPGSSGTHVSATTPTRTSYERPTKYDGYSNLPPPPSNRPPNSQNLRPGSSQNSYPAYPQASSRPTSSGSHSQSLKPAAQTNYVSYAAVPCEIL